MYFLIELYPWSVSIQYKETKGHICGGFIVTMDDGKGRAWVATSASCMYEHTQGVMNGVTVCYCKYIERFTI